jgi:polysaccharide chain length determinant protein (PEP-CTERM system associated)
VGIKEILSEGLNLLIRRRWLILIPLALGLAAAPILARWAPERYRSTALIMVIPQQVPTNYVNPTVSETVAGRLPAITDQILSRSRLERIIQEMELYKAERAKQVMEDVVQTMRGDITTTAVEPTATNAYGRPKEIDSFRISFVNENAEIARKVTERLASLYIEQNLKDRESQADNTSQFLATELEEAKRRLIEQEKKLEQYRRSHAGQLPSQLGGNLQAIQNANYLLQNLNEATNRAQERRLLIERQIMDTQAVPLPSAPPPVVAVTPETTSITTAQQLEIARARLAALLQRYTPDHPEVVTLQRTISELTVRLDQEAPVGNPLPTPEKTITPGEAAQKKRILDLQAELAVIDHQLAANRAEGETLKETIAAYQAKVDVVPTRESELVELTRDYTTLQTGYANLLMKREDSAIAANLERRQIGEQFKLLDAASLPERPYNRTERIRIIGSGALAGLGLGLLVALMLEYGRSHFRREDEVLKMLNLPVLALIPVMTSDREQRKARWGRLAIDIAGTAVLLAVVAVLMHWRVRL